MPTYRRTYLLALATTYIVMSIGSVGFLIFRKAGDNGLVTTASGVIELLVASAFMSLLFVGAIFGVYSGLNTLIHLSRLMGKRVATDSPAARALAIIVPVSEKIPPGLESSDYVVAIWKRYRSWDLRCVAQLAISGAAYLFLEFIMNVRLS